MNDVERILSVASGLAAVGLWLLLPRGRGRGRAAGAVLALAGLGMWASQLPGVGDWLANSLFAALAGVTTLLGALGLWLMLPRGTHRGRYLGMILAVIALGAGASQLPYLGDWLANGLFATLAGVTILSAAATVTFRSPVYCAIWFGMTLVGVAGLFLTAGAGFLAMATLVVYAGAILVTFLFVLMLCQPEGHTSYDRRSWEALLSAATGSAMIGILSIAMVGVTKAGGVAARVAEPAPAATTDQVARLGAELFTRHLVAVEAAGVLLFAALVGAAVITTQGRRGRD